MNNNKIFITVFILSLAGCQVSTGHFAAVEIEQPPSLHADNLIKDDVFEASIMALESPQPSAPLMLSSLSYPSVLSHKASNPSDATPAEDELVESLLLPDNSVEDTSQETEEVSTPDDALSAEESDELYDASTAEDADEPFADTAEEDDEALFEDSEPMPADLPVAESYEEPAIHLADRHEQLPDDVATVWQQIREGFVLSDHDHPGIQGDLNWYLKNPDYLYRTSERAEPYLYFILQELKARGMPTEIALLPIVESAFQPFAYSHGRAAGIWQFIPGTGRLYGLKQNWWYDGRRDVYAATRAALTYLQKLNKDFEGDWLLALAAYNSGEGTVMKAVARNRKAGKKTDFWSLQLPRETRGYVPKLLALAHIVTDPARYDINLLAIPNEPYFAKVDTGSQIDLALAAELAELSTEELYRLNPGFNRWATDPDGPHYLLIPEGISESFETELAKIPANERISWSRHKVKPGETLSHIAKRYHTSVDQIKKINNIRSHTIRAGNHLLIPTSSRNIASYTLTADQRHASIQAREREGEKQIHQVRAGDTLWDISQEYNVNVRTLAKWNGMAPRDVIKPGQKLVVWTKDVTTKSTTLPPSAVTQRIRYRVRKGDSLSRIAQRFRVKVSDLVRWNKIDKDNYLRPGQALTLFVDVTRQSGSL